MHALTNGKYIVDEFTIDTRSTCTCTKLDNTSSLLVLMAPMNDFVVVLYITHCFMTCVTQTPLVVFFLIRGQQEGAYVKTRLSQLTGQQLI